ncbi:galactose mutarotase [Rhodobacteraceae bacterium CCMM004]|nr:galactose mutarotase [Rhodobacteraceae bacterium CCMM004]
MSKFGALPDGRRVDIHRMSAGDLSASVLTLGAILNDLRVGDRPLALGSPDVGPYAGRMGHFGAIMGPVVNRLSGAAAEIDGTRHSFEPKEGKSYTQHSGSAGIHRKVWQVVRKRRREIVLAVEMPDGEGGFPGNRRLTATWTLDAGGLTLTLEAETDAPTLMNPAFHGYWNLTGAPDWGGHRLQVLAERWLPTDADDLPTGGILPTAGGLRDFRAPRTVTPRDTPKLDHNFCLAAARGPRRPAVRLEGGGMALTVETTAPGVQVFDMGTIDLGDVPTHHGHGYRPYAGLAFEPQMWPDAPAHPAFPSILLGPGETFRQETRFAVAPL